MLGRCAWMQSLDLRWQHRRMRWCAGMSSRTTRRCCGWNRLDRTRWYA